MYCLREQMGAWIIRQQKSQISRLCYDEFTFWLQGREMSQEPLCDGLGTVWWWYLASGFKIWCWPLLGKNRRLDTDEPVEFEKYLVEVHRDFRRITDRFGESIEYTSNEWKHQNRKISTCKRLDLESLGSWLTMPKNFRGTGADRQCNV